MTTIDARDLRRWMLRAAWGTTALVFVLVHPGVPVRDARAGGPYDLSGACGADAAANGAALRAALRAAGDDSAPVVIKLASKCTYAFSDVDPGDAAHVPGNWYGPTALPAITNAITIEGNGSTITRTGTTPFRFFSVIGPTSVASGVQSGLRAGSLTLKDLQLTNGLARGGNGGDGLLGGGGGAGMGGAIFAEGDLTLVGVTLSGNVARGGDGGKGIPFTWGTWAAGGGGGGMGGNGGVVDQYGGGGGGGMGGNGGAGALGGGGGFHGNGGGGTISAGGSSGGGGGGVYSDATGPTPGDGGGVPGKGSTSAVAGSKGGPGGGGGSSSVTKGSETALAGGGGGFGGGGGGGSTGGDGGVGGGGAGGGGSNVTSGGKGGFGGGAGGGGGGGTAGGFGGGSGGHGTPDPVMTAPYGGGGQKYSGGGIASGGGGGGLGGAIFVMAGTTKVTNSTLSANQALGGGGYSAGSGAGVAVFVYGGTATLDSVTAVGNESSSGGALEVYGGTLRVSNSLIVNATGSPCNKAGSGAFASLKGNVVRGTGSCTFAVGDKVNPMPAPAPGPLADNGGLTPTHAITKTDPAFGASSCIVTADQRGLRRPTLAKCDAGSFELVTSVKVTVTGSGSVSSSPGNIACGAVCEDVFKPGDTVTLTETPTSPAMFLGWSGDIGSASPTASMLNPMIGLTPLTFEAKFETLDAGPETGADAESDAVSDTGATGGELPDASAKPTVGNATSCTTDGDCAGKKCVEGVCCDRACDGVCESCRVPSSPGVCTLIPFGTDTKGACTSGTTCLKTCDGAGACIDAQAGSECAPSVCIDGSTVRAIGVCSAKGGTCSTPTTTFDCSPYSCDSLLGGCKNACATSNDCATGFTCDIASRLCVATPPESDEGGCHYGRPAGTSWWLFAGLAALLSRRLRFASRGRSGRGS